LEEPVLTPTGLKSIDLSTLVEKKKKNKFKLEQSPKLIPLTKDQWDALPPKAQWDCIVALRGPDLRYSECLKFLTSSVIRYKLSGIMRVGGLINDRLPFVVVVSSFSEKSDFNFVHFIGHIMEAANWLSIPQVSVPSEVMKKIMSGQINRLAGALEVLPHASKEQQEAIKYMFAAGYYPIPDNSNGESNAQG
jgi:hypothetical protein